MPTNKQRRDAQRRHLERQLERRREREVKRRKTNLIISIVGTLVLIGAVVVVVVITTGGDDKKSPPVAYNSSTPTTQSTPPTSSSSSTAPVAAYPCTWTKGGTASKKASVPPTTTPPKKGTVVETVDTTQGTLKFTLNRAEAPCAVESFVSLAAQKYFDNTPCHRLTTSAGLSVLQCGDPSGTGTGGPGYSFNDELSGNEKYTRGTLAMANGGANTNGSQFFIVYKDSQLGANYTVFGTVDAAGLKVVDKVAAAGSDNSTGEGDGKPKLAITLKTVKQAS